MKANRIFILVLVLIFIISCNQTAENSPPKTVSNDKAKFIDLLDDKKNLEFQATYSVGSIIGGKENVVEMTEYVKGRKLRMDVTSEKVEGRTYFLEDVSAFCSKKPAGAWDCVKINKQNDPLKQFNDVEKDVKNDANAVTVVYDGTTQIAGVTAECYKVTMGTIQALVKYCFSKEGVPLLMRTEAKTGTFYLEAKKYSTSVSDSAFQLPAEAKELNIPKFS